MAKKIKPAVPLKDGLPAPADKKKLNTATEKANLDVSKEYRPRQKKAK